MRNDDYKQELDHTELLEKYNGYIIAWAVNRSRSEPGKWMGHFRAYKDDTPTLRGSIGNLQDNEGNAQDKAIDLAKATIDKEIAAQG